jgi:hypothetical protein
MSPSEHPQSLFIFRGHDIGGTLIRCSSGRFRIMVDGHRARFLGLCLAALGSGRVDDQELRIRWGQLGPPTEFTSALDQIRKSSESFTATTQKLRVMVMRCLFPVPARPGLFHGVPCLALKQSVW